MILERRANGYGEPILRHLALRGYGPALLDLANRYTQTGSLKELGRLQNRNSPIAQTYRAYRNGELNAAQNMAMSLYNVGDLHGYRRWLYRAARMGDLDARRELSHFGVRQPHGLARRLRRLRPLRRDGT
ncbi:hypothetical protein [Sphingomonas sp.]|uniref:hypothetical protein n=1 Tax=Sphingomonas sp. TaxID=28214 RepID=UPI00307F7516